MFHINFFGFLKNIVTNFLMIVFMLFFIKETGECSISLALVCLLEDNGTNFDSSAGMY